MGRAIGNHLIEYEKLEQRREKEEDLQTREKTRCEKFLRRRNEKTGKMPKIMTRTRTSGENLCTLIERVIVEFDCMYIAYIDVHRSVAVYK